jgi:hypothetical protein
MDEYINYKSHKKDGFLSDKSRNCNGDGYIFNGIKLGNNKSRCCMRHRLVAESFILNPNNYKVVNHKDFNKLNNKVDNLEWCDTLYNVRYSIHRRPKKYNTIRFFSEEDIINIREMIKNNIESKEIAKKYNTYYQQINNIKFGNTYSWVI